MENYCKYCGGILQADAKFCSNCGKAVLNIDDEPCTNVAPTGKMKSSNKIVDQSTIIPGWMHQMQLLGRNIEFDQAIVGYSKLRVLFSQNSDSCINDFLAYYRKNVKDFDSLYDKGLPYFLEKVVDSIKFGEKTLKNYGVRDVDEGQLAQLAISRIDIEGVLKDYIELAEQITQFAEQLSSYRAQNRSGSHLYWQGGGFGLKGALSGAVIAGILNLGTGALREVGHAIVDSSDRAKLKKLKDEIFKNFDHLKDLTQKLNDCCIGVLDTVEYILEISRLMIKPKLDSEAASVLYAKAASIVKNATPYMPKSEYEKAIDLICTGLPKDPYQVSPYITLYQIPFIEKSEIRSFTRYFGLDGEYLRKKDVIDSQEIARLESLPDSTIEQVEAKIQKFDQLKTSNPEIYVEDHISKLQRKKEALDEASAKERVRAESQKRIELAKAKFQGSMDKVEKLYKENQIEEIWKMADESDPYAQYKLVAYYFPRVIDLDKLKEFEPMWKRHESMGSQFAKCELAYRYYHEYEWLQQKENNTTRYESLLLQFTKTICELAEQGVARAMAHRGMWGTEEGILRNPRIDDSYQMSVDFLIKAADKCDVSALRTLAKYYKEGSNGFPKDQTLSKQRIWSDSGADRFV